MIKDYFSSMQDVRILIESLLTQYFNISTKMAESYSQKNILPHFNNLKDHVFLVAEAPYVDKVYRDSFYHYFSSKLFEYKRNCVRISLFNEKVGPDDFKEQKGLQRVQRLYRGFIILRPTEPGFIGRSVIAPDIVKRNPFYCCQTRIEATVLGVKVQVSGFPHSSQDSETITCAETTVWSIMEYYGNHYPEYKTVLPSHILNNLNRVTTERQIPSRGLTPDQISYVLREFGFGTRLYTADGDENRLHNLISCYVESGIPLILAVDNYSIKGSIGHAIVCMGHVPYTKESIRTLTPNQFPTGDLLNEVQVRNLKIYDLDNIEKEFVFIDDNKPIYQIASLKSPFVQYADPWKDCKISSFIAPLYTKIYLEAYQAKSFLLRFLVNGPMPLNVNTSLLIKTFLTSSRSYKDAVILNRSISKEIQTLILKLPMPKFIWVSELSDHKLIQQKKANGLVILDATEANTSGINPLLLASYQDNTMIFNPGVNKFQTLLLSLQPYNIYENNLKANCYGAGN
jgi:hypothetical protein